MARPLHLAAIALFAIACGKDGPAAANPGDVAVGPVAPGSAAPAPPPPPAPPRRDAQEIAERMVGARSATLLHVAAWQGHGTIRELSTWMPLRGALERARVDVTRDIDRVFLASSNPREWAGLTVFEHHIDRERLLAFLHEGAASSQPVGQPLTQGDMVGARMHVPVRYRGREQTFSADVWLVTPTLIVVVAPETPGVAAFARSGGLPMPTQGEGASGWALEPAELFRNAHVKIPESLQRAEGWVFPRPGGGVHVDVRARSTSHDQAMSDATRLTGSLEKATTVKLGPLSVKVFQTPVFRAEGDEIVAGMDITKAQLDQALAMAGSSRPKY